jgi:streptomycin 6-kinase
MAMALLLERAEGARSLAEYARNGRDDEATQIICDVVAELHVPRTKPLPDLIPPERGFDHANLFCNPDLSDPCPPVAIRPERFLRRLEIVVERVGIERQRLLAWILAWAGLSVAWFLGDGESAEIDLRVSEIAATELAR